MEDGRPIHYDRNTVNSPRPSARNLRRRRERILNDEVEIRSMPMEPKIVLHLECVWCQFKRPGGEYFAVCPRCRSCQYCGLVSKFKAYCLTCGNHLDEGMDPPKPPRRIRQSDIVHDKPAKTKKPKSRLRPIRANRGPRLIS